MHTIYIDADARPVKDEAYRVAGRYGLRVAVVVSAAMRVPAVPSIQLVVRPGFGAADDWIAEQAGVGDVVVTADVPLSARCVARRARVLDPKGREFTERDLGAALAARDLLEHLQQAGVATGGPAPMKPRDRSRFLSKLDEAVNAVRRENP